MSTMHPIYLCVFIPSVSVQQDRLVANEFIQCRKVCEHVLDKVLGAETTPGTAIATNNSQNSQNSDANSESSQIPPEDKIELLCNDIVSVSIGLALHKYSSWLNSAQCSVIGT